MRVPVAAHSNASSRTRDVVNPTWLAPEVIEGKPVDRTNCITQLSKLTRTVSSEVYAFGIILWELVARSHPFGEFHFDFMFEIEDCVKVPPHFFDSIFSFFFNKKMLLTFDSPKRDPASLRLRHHSIEVSLKIAGLTTHWREFLSTTAVNGIIPQSDLCTVDSSTYIA